MAIKRMGKSKISMIRKESDIILRETICKIKEIKTVLNAGSSQNSMDGHGDLYRNYFKSVDYYTLDNNKGESKKNHFNMDLHDLSSLDMKFDLVLCTSVLEHVRNPFLVAQQLESVSSGYIFVVVPFMFPFHPKVSGKVKDYWRFTDSGLRELFNNSIEVWIKNIKSVIRSVKDKKEVIGKPHKGWTKANSSTGYVALFEKKK